MSMDHEKAFNEDDLDKLSDSSEQENIIEEPEKKPHNKKWKYILIGMMIVMLPLVGLCSIGTWLLRSNNLYLTIMNERNVSTTNKLSAIQALIDRYYLFDYEQKDIDDNTLKGYVSGLGDPYSAYYDKDEYKALQESNSGTYYGIGVMITEDASSGIITITRVFSNSPAKEAGMLAEDILVTVDGEEVTGMDLNNVVAKIKGAEGSTVKVEVSRKGQKKLIEMDVERREVDVDTVVYKMMDDKIGYVELVEFDTVSTEQLKSALEDLKKQGMESLVLDLRDNPGGMLDTAIKIADVFIDTGVVISTEDSQGNTKDYEATEEGRLEIPCVILVNGNSASASEVLSGCLKYYKAATLVGEKTFGKGIVQNIIPLTDGSAVKLTIAHYYLPDGNDIHKKGIEPDITVEDDPETEEDEQLQRGIQVLTEQK